jgi:hypothetical protein
LHGFYQGQIDPIEIQYAMFGQHPQFHIADGAGCCYLEPVPAVIRLLNFHRISPAATLALRLMKNWFPGACFTDVVTVNVGAVGIERYGLDAVFCVSSDGRLFEDLALTIPAN